MLSFTPTKNYQPVGISTPEMKKGAYTRYTGGTKAGTETDGLLTGGTATGGTKVVAFDITDSPTTWLNESGVTAGNTAGRGPGGGGGGRGMRPDGARPGGAAPPEGGTPPENGTPTEG
ncbi:dockerin type 1, partial [Clostridium perfringens]